MATQSNLDLGWWVLGLGALGVLAMAAGGQLPTAIGRLEQYLGTLGSGKTAGSSHQAPTVFAPHGSGQSFTGGTYPYSGNPTIKAIQQFLNATGVPAPNVAAQGASKVSTPAQRIASGIEPVWAGWLP